MTTLISYAQNFEDVMLWRALKHVEKGRYIDVGAQDPIIDSVSKFFHEQGWQGIHVEPTPNYAEQLRQGRPKDIVLQAALGSKVGTLKFYEFPDTGLSTDDRTIAKKHLKSGFQGREIVVPCITLDNVLANFSDEEIHWLKIDVEGGEQRVLKGWTQSNARPWIVLIESTLPLTQVDSHKKWEAIVLSKGYEFAYFDGLNRFYVADGHADLLKAFTAGPNLFDGFLLSRNSWPWCTSLSTQLQATEEKLDKERQAATIRLQQREDELLAQLSANQTEITRQNVASADVREELVARLVVSQQSAFDAASALADTEATLGAKLANSLAESIRHVRELAQREREFAAQLDERDQSFRVEISNAQTEVARFREQLVGKEGQLVAVQNAAEQESLRFLQKIELREQEIAIQLARHEKKLSLTISASRTELERVAQALAAKEHDVKALQQAHEQEQLARTFALHAREQEFAGQVVSWQKQVDFERAAQNSLHHKQLRALTDEHVVREKTITESVQSLQQELRLIEKDRLQRERVHADEIELAHRELQEVHQCMVAREQETIAQINKTQQTVSARLTMESEFARKLQIYLAAAESESLSMRESLSWRITIPLRRIFGQGISAAEANAAHKKRLDEIAAWNEFAGSPEMKINMMNKSMLESSTRLSASTVLELLEYDGKDFVDNVFYALLGRAPDLDASVFYLDRIRSGTTKKQVLVEIGASDEGRAYSTVSSERGLHEEARLNPAASMAELLSYHDRSFINCAYKTILGRYADPDGLAAYLAKLRDRTEKIQILAEIRLSHESKKKAELRRCLRAVVHQNDRKKLPLIGWLFKNPTGSPVFASAKGNPPSNGSGNATSSELESVAAFLNSDDSRFVNNAYLTLLGREVDSQGADFYNGRLEAGTPRIQLISEILRSEEGKRLQAILINLDSAIDLYLMSKRSTQEQDEPSQLTKMAQTISDWPVIGRFLNVTVALTRLSRYSFRHQLLVKEELPGLVQQHLDLALLQNPSAIDDVPNLVKKYLDIHFQNEKVEMEQMSDLLRALSEVKLAQHALETERLPNLLQTLSEIKERQHVMETQHLPNLLQTLSELNHRQLTSDHAEDNLVKSVPVALRKITRDVHSIMARLGDGADQRPQRD